MKLSMVSADILQVKIRLSWEALKRVQFGDVDRAHNDV